MRWLFFVACLLVSCGSDTSREDGGPAGGREDGPGDTTQRDSGFANAMRDGGPPELTVQDSGDGDFDECRSLEAMAGAVPVLQADIIWIIDNNLNFVDWVGAITAKLSEFSENLSKVAPDPRVIMISAPADGSPAGVCVAAPLGSGNCPDDSNPPSYLHIIERRTDTKPPAVTDLDVLVDNPLSLVMNTIDQWRHMLRDGAFKTFVVLTNDDTHITPEYFNAWIDTEPDIEHGRWALSGILCTDATLPCYENRIGYRYLELIEQTGGLATHLGDLDFQAVLESISARITETVAPLPCEWEIPEAPDGRKLDPEKVNLQYVGGDGNAQRLQAVDTFEDCEVAEGGWYYDDPEVPTRIQVCPRTCDVMRVDPKAAVDIAFGCTRELAPELI